MEGSMSVMEEPAEVLDEISETGVNFGGTVTLFNDSIHTFEEVSNQLILALNCSEKKAFELAYIADTRGSVIVYTGDMEEAVRISSVLGEIGLITRITI